MVEMRGPNAPEMSPLTRDLLGPVDELREIGRRVMNK